MPIIFFSMKHCGRFPIQGSSWPQMEKECEADVKELQLPSAFQWGFDNNTQNFNRPLCGGGGKQKALS